MRLDRGFIVWLSLSAHEIVVQNFALAISQFPTFSSKAILSLMVLVIDNYDSFTYNLVQYLGEMQVEMEVHRNDQLSIEQIKALKPDRILISPGPCSPRE